MRLQLGRLESTHYNSLEEVILGAANVDLKCENGIIESKPVRGDPCGGFFPRDTLPPGWRLEDSYDEVQWETRPFDRQDKGLHIFEQRDIESLSIGRNPTNIVAASTSMAARLPGSARLLWPAHPAGHRHIATGAEGRLLPHRSGRRNFRSELRT